MTTPLPRLSDAELAQAIKALRSKRKGWEFESLEDLFTSSDGFGIETATPLQRAICRILDGTPLGELASHPHVAECIGEAEALAKLNGAPLEVVILAGIRTGKSLLAAAFAIYISQTCDVSKLGPGEIPRVSVVSITKDLAKVIFDHIKGHLVSRPKLKALMVGDMTADTVTLRHPTGRPIEIKVVAGSRAGASLVARWSAGVIFDEAPRMIGSDEGVVNLDDALNAVVGRMLPGAIIAEIGSPWRPYGPVFERVTKHGGSPSQRVVVIRAPAHYLNPIQWTEERREKMRVSDPEAYQTDVLAQFADSGDSLYPIATLNKCTRKDPTALPYSPAHEYVAAMDPATRGNAWALIVADRKGRKKRVVLAREWQGSPVDPLSPKRVLSEIALTLDQYGLDWVYTDQWAADALTELGFECGITLVPEDWTAANKVHAFTSLGVEMAEGRVELPPDPTLRKDLQLVSKAPRANGLAINLPRTPDGRHCDYAPALARALFRWIEGERELPPEHGTPERAEWELQRMEEEEMERFEQGQKEWWA